MSADYFFPCFVLFSLSGIFLWLAGAAAFFRENWLESLYCAPWLGYGILVGALQLAHLFSPITRDASIIVLAIICILAAALLLAQLLRTRPDRQSTIRWTMLLALLAVIALLTFIPVFNCCTKEDFSIRSRSLLLANDPLDGNFSRRARVGQFATSSCLQSKCVSCDVSFRFSCVQSLGNFLHRWRSAMVGTFAIVVRLGPDHSSKFCKTAGGTPIEMAYAISFPAWIFVLLRGNISSASPDSISFCLMLHFFIVFSCFIVSRSDEELRWRLGEILFLGALCLCVSLNSLGLVGGVLAVLWREDLSSKERLRLLQAKTASRHDSPFRLSYLSTWMGRGVLLSGYPFFPSSASAMPVAWRMPVKQVNSFRGMMIAWRATRIPTETSREHLGHGAGCRAGFSVPIPRSINGSGPHRSA